MLFGWMGKMRRGSGNDNLTSPAQAPELCMVGRVRRDKALAVYAMLPVFYFIFLMNKVFTKYISVASSKKVPK